VPESIYNGKTLEGEEREFDFDDLVVNSKAYRDVMRAAHRKSSLQAGNSSMWRSPQESSSSQTQLNASSYINDLLSDLPVSEKPDPQYPTEASLEMPPLPSYDPEENLIDLSDPEPQHRLMGPPQSTPISQPSSHLNDLMDIIWSEPVQQVQAIQPVRLLQQVEHVQETQPVQPTFRSSIHESISENDRRDSGRSHLHQSDNSYSSEKIYIPPESYDDKIVVDPPPEDEKIVVIPDESTPRPDSISRDSLGRASSVMSQGSVTQSPRRASQELHPTDKRSSITDLPSPMTPTTSYFGFRRSSGAEALVPPEDGVIEEKLLDEMNQCLTASNPTIQLDWAEDALRYCRMCSDFEKRASKTQKARASVPAGEEKLHKMAMQVVEGAATAGNGRALFIKGRLVEKDQKAVMECLEGARRAGYHRSHYWIGQQCLADKNPTALWHFETGVKYGDQACQFVSFLNHFHSISVY
jgi:hypothetical protein